MLVTIILIIITFDINIISNTWTDNFKKSLDVNISNIDYKQYKTVAIFYCNGYFFFHDLDNSIFEDIPI